MQPLFNIIAMKKYIMLIVLIIVSKMLFAQTINFINELTNNDLINSCTSVKQGTNSNYYLLYGVLNPGTQTVTNKIILRLNNNGERIDSINVDILFNFNNYVLTQIEKANNNFIYWTTLSDNVNNYLFVKVFDTALNTIAEKIIDTISVNEFVCWHITTSNNHHVFLTLTKEENAWYRYLIYETDQAFNLIRKINPDYRDGYYVSITEMTKDSSYLITSKNWIIKSDNSFSYFDTIVNRWQTELIETYNFTKRYSDSSYIESSSCIISGWPEQYPYPGFFLRTVNAEILDTIAIPIEYPDNRLTQLSDFIDYVTPDTLFYCAVADYKDWEFPLNSQFVIAKLNINGEIFWQKFFGGNGNYRNGTLAATSDGGCIIQWNYWDWEKYPADWHSSNIIIFKTDKYGNAPVGIKEIVADEKQFPIYPNPASDFINFETGLYKNVTLQIFNSTGQFLLEKKLKQGKNTIPLNKFPYGIYFYRLLNKEAFLENGSFIKL